MNLNQTEINSRQQVSSKMDLKWTKIRPKLIHKRFKGNLLGKVPKTRNMTHLAISFNKVQIDIVFWNVSESESPPFEPPGPSPPFFHRIHFCAPLFPGHIRNFQKPLVPFQAPGKQADTKVTKCSSQCKNATAHLQFKMVPQFLFGASYSTHFSFLPKMHTIL